MTRGVKTSSEGAMRRVRKWLRSVVDNRWLYVLVLPALIYLLVFNYLPMYGIFELILRLKGNYIWPAMHVNAYNMNPENGRLAERMGIVTGTSHCDMLHRSNQNEWKP